MSYGQQNDTTGTSSGTSMVSMTGGSQSQYASAYGGQTLGSSTQQSQYLIPGAQPAYAGILGGLQGGYAGLGGNLASMYAGLTPGVLGAYGGLLNQGMAAAGSYGQTQLAQIQQAYAQQQAQQNQGLLNRGLGNSTVMNAVDTGLTQAEQLNLTNLGQDIGQYQLGALSQFGLPYAQAYQGLGSQQIAQQLGVGQQGLAAQQALGQQYLGLVGQQGVQTTTQSQQQAQSGQQQGTQSQQYDQTSDNQWNQDFQNSGSGSGGYNPDSGGGPYSDPYANAGGPTVYMPDITNPTNPYAYAYGY